ncbi:REP element-mobilizing transposase RayT [Prosthecobacter vanneervenii]|uniref:REP element-mobilizing transposase RayT n=2 Tax=Prosthecobacter vanneervenii TaxID=48466 RepID=A0A7W7YEF7_9BACT|nr:REP element-mobilizing transposase RayT [Prosthecobacter vanneervenii]
MRTIGREDFTAFDWDAVDAGHGRHLPQLALKGAIYFVTFRLEDSVPQKLLKQWLYKRQAWLAEHPEPWDETTRREHRSLFTARMERWLDAGYGGCLLRDERCRREVVDRLLFKHGQDYDLGDWVVMPNHVHVLLKPLGEVSLEEIMKPVKGVSARNINHLLGRSGSLWMQESFSHIVRSLEQLKKFQCYIQTNPMKAHLPAPDFSYEQRWQIV